MRLDQARCRELFAAARVARLASVNPDGTPHLVPVTFAVVDDAVVFAVDHKPKSGHRLQRLVNIVARPRVSFLVDRYGEDWTTRWWVRADADAAVLEPGLDAPVAWISRPDAITALTEKYQQYRDVELTGTVVVATVRRWSGWSGDAPDHRR